LTYKSNDDVRHFYGMLDDLAFPEISNIQKDIAYFKDDKRDVVGINNVLDYFTTRYVSCSLHCMRQVL